MAKKALKKEAKQIEQEAAQRAAAIKEFNMNNMGEAWIDPEKVPSEEDIDQAKKDFEETTKALQEKKDYLVADKANALRVAKFIKEFIENGFWTQRFFVGVINFSDYINTFIEECEKEEKELVLEYGPLQFCFLMFENYAGHGLESAKKMAEMWNEYVPIYDTLHEHVDYYNNEAKRCEKLKQRWAMMCQGYFLTFLDENSEDPTNNTADTAKEACEPLEAECECTGEYETPCDCECSNECTCNCDGCCTCDKK